MAKPVVFVSAGGKPVVIAAAGGLPVTEVSALGQPVTEVSALGQPVTLVADEAAPATWEPSWVDNGGTAYISFDGTAVGADSDKLEIVAGLRSLDSQPAAISRIYYIVAGRVVFGFTAAWRVSVVLSSSAPATLVNWTSSNNGSGIFHSAGEYEFRMRADLGGTPTMEVWVRTTTDGVTGDWSVVPGSFTTGPTTGTIDCARGGQAGNEFGILARETGADPCDCEFAYLWVKSGSLQDEDAFGADGVRIDPATVSTPDLYVTGPVANLTVDAGGGKTLVVNNTFTDVS